ncbi:MAG: PEP/pyruvate-binding domain-containing protein [Myxococcales bacterium]|nr:PEP/pyruvate-binding domain-containing protein [Myxococcales bacterium]
MSRIAWAALVVLSWVVGAGCKTKQAPPPPQVIDAGPQVALVDAAPPEVDAGEAAVAPAPRRLWTDRIDDEATMMAYSVEIGGERFTKFILDTKTDAIYYFDVDVYKVHKDFIFGELLKTPKTKALNRQVDRNYGYGKPNYMMCYLVHHLASDLWTLAFWEGDKASAAHITRAYNRMKATFYLGDKVSYRPDSDYQEQVAKQLKGVPVITNDKLYKSATYQAFNPGRAIGRLRLVPAGADFEELTFAPDEIVILPESLPDITPVAGILSETFSTPLAHVSLRARAWGIPNVGLRGAAVTYAALVGKTVVFEATAAGHTLREATPAEIDAWATRTQAARTVKIPPADLAARDLRGLDQLRAVDARAYGTKAANLGEIVAGKLTGFAVPPGFGVPIAYYDAHLEAAGLDARIAALLADDRFRTDARYRKQALTDLRAAISAAPLDPAFTALLGRRLGELTGGDPAVGVFVRSSTNAEDLPGFSGAGLYDTIPNAKGPDAVAQAIKDVWASVWTLRGYEERQLFGIDHTQVYGAVLVQVGVNATAAGVLVTAHPTDPSQTTTYTINAKSGLGLRVVEGKKVPESLLYDVHNRGLRILSRSDEDTMLVFDGQGGVREVPNPKKGQPVITQARAEVLGRAARAIWGLFSPDTPLDIEWLFVGDALYIVQARPYVVR